MSLTLTRKELAALGFTVVDGKAVKTGSLELAATKKQFAGKRLDGFRCGWEARYAERLELEKRVGRILSFEFERERLVIGEGATYKPDFAVLLPDGTKEYREVKGHKREAAIVRIKAAALRYPDRRFVMVSLRRGQWVEIGRWGKR